MKATKDNYPTALSHPDYCKRDLAEQEWHKAAAAQLAETDTILCLWKHGATYDGDVPSKSGRDQLLELGLCTKVCGPNGEQGYQALTYRGYYVVKELRSNRLRDWFDRQDGKAQSRKFVNRLIETHHNENLK